MVCVVGLTSISGTVRGSERFGLCRDGALIDLGLRNEKGGVLEVIFFAAYIYSVHCKKGGVSTAQGECECMSEGLSRHRNGAVQSLGLWYGKAECWEWFWRLGES